MDDVKVLAVGCFDPLHYGHLLHLQKARSLGTHLMVGLTADEVIGKGPGRPAFPWREREAMLYALRCVDGVMLHRDIETTLRLYSPNLYVKGDEYEDVLPEQALCERLGIEVVFLRTRPVYSSSKLLSGALLDERIQAARAGGQ